jgi:hypothetical protein
MSLMQFNNLSFLTYGAIGLTGVILAVATAYETPEGGSESESSESSAAPIPVAEPIKEEPSSFLGSQSEGEGKESNSLFGSQSEGEGEPSESFGAAPEGEGERVGGKKKKKRRTKKQRGGKKARKTKNKKQKQKKTK